ncbi:MAG: hypothetical protein LBV68_08750 [Spirochaetaceae bacterium]|jgi:hypothetical protein|nr:hypothetical protein [Spirochaetaceae bacterium]
MGFYIHRKSGCSGIKRDCRFFHYASINAGILAFCFCLFSCTEDTAINNLFGISAETPVYNGCKVPSGKQVNFDFSTDVHVRYARFQPDIPVEQTLDGKTVSVFFAEERAGGEKIIADVLVEDSAGNTLNILVPFRTRNERIPKFVINEIRFDYSKPRAEFIELKTKSAGNFGAVKLFIASANAGSFVYEFPPVEAAENEYIILHLRTLATDNGIDETGSALNLAVSGNTGDTPKDARDLWIPSNQKLLHKTDVIYFVDQDDKIIDGILCSEDEKAWGKNKAFDKAAELLAAQGQWLSKDAILIKSPSAADAAVSNTTTLTRTLCRDETKDDSNTLLDWYICNTSKGSPGKRNSEDRYN